MDGAVYTWIRRLRRDPALRTSAGLIASMTLASSFIYLAAKVMRSRRCGCSLAISSTMPMA